MRGADSPSLDSPSVRIGFWHPFENRPVTSGLVRLADIPTVARHVSKVPTPVLAAALPVLCKTQQAKPAENLLPYAFYSPRVRQVMP
jgi:hypothetical protein